MFLKRNNMMSWKFYTIMLLLLSKNLDLISAHTHWVVTETGRIQPYLGSPFDLRRPYDLLALLEQEVRNDDINKIYKDLIYRKEVIEKKWATLEGNSNIGVKITSQDYDCLASGKLFSEIDLYANMVTNGTDRDGISVDFSGKGDKEDLWEEPHCVKFSTLKKRYSNIADMENNTNIRLTPDGSLYQFIPVESVEVFGHEIAMALRKNATSWLHYNLAAIFWRIKGDGDKAIDCIKRAIQYAPREYQDIPLYNLAAILHQARHSREAALMLHKAIDIAPHQAIHYLAIGNVYAAMGDYNRSVMYYDKFLEINPGQKDVIANKHATLCYWKLEKGLLSFQESLQGILSDLHDYHSQQQQWLRLQERLMWEHASFEYQFEGLPNMQKYQGNIQRCVQKTSDDSKVVISCDTYSSPDVEHLSLQNIFQYVENEKQKIHNQISKASEDKFSRLESDEKKYNPSKSPPVLYPKFPTSMSTSGNQYFDMTGWPTKEECINWDLPIDEEDDLDLPLFLPPENKGYQVKRILSDYIGLSEGAEHELPWYPPVCEYPNVFGEKFIPSTARNVLNTAELKSNDYLKKQLLRYVNDGKADEAEIGQRIITAMEMRTAPRWVLTTLASLYWRVRGNARRALDCLDAALQSVPRESTDAVLVSVGSVAHHLGLTEQAMKFAALAFKINYVEPSTNFLLALLHYGNKNPLLAMYYMKNVLRADHAYYDGLAERLLRTWGCRIKLGGATISTYRRTADGDHASPVAGDGDLSKGICGTEMKATGSEGRFRGEKIVCSSTGGATVGGQMCENLKIKCYRRDSMGSSGNEGLSQSTLQCGETGQAMNIDPTQRFSSRHPLRGQHRPGNLGATIISSLLAAAAAGSGESSSNDIEPDQSRLERLATEKKPRHAAAAAAFHMRLSLGDEQWVHQEHHALGDFYVALTEDPQAENQLHVYDKFGTYILSATTCKNVKILNEFKYATVWPSIVIRNLDLTSYLKPKTLDKHLEPYCMDAPRSMPSIQLDSLINSILKHRLPSSPEKDLIELLGLMASDQKIALKELGAKIGTALKENATSWILCTASAIYWRILGNTEEAVNCLKVALAYVPSDKMDIPLHHLANLLNRIGFHLNALELAQLALKTHQNFVLNHFTMANIHISLGEYEKAVAFYRGSLALDSNFEPARTRLHSVLCTLLFEDSNIGKQSDTSD